MRTHVTLALVLALAACGDTGFHADASSSDGAAPVDLIVADLAATVDLANCAPVTLSDIPACNDCLATRCCAVIGGCPDDGGCAGVWDHSALIGCMTNACATACNRGLAHCGGIQATPASCASCVYKTCCAEATRCAMDDSCLALIYQCIDELQANEGDCEAKHPAGMADFEALNNCGLDNCPGCF